MVSSVRNTTVLMKLDELELDPEAYQRTPSPSRIAHIQANWDPIAAGVLIVNCRTNGRVFVIDGGHRLYAMRGLGIKKWLCVVYEGLDVTEESLAFVRANTVTNLLHKQIFKARIHGGDPVALEILSLVEAEGFHMNVTSHPSGHKSHNIRAPKTVESIYATWGGPHLSLVLKVIMYCWPSEVLALAAPAVMGLAYFMANAAKFSIDLNDITHKFQLTTALELQHKARDFKSLEGGNADSAYYRAYAEFYNRGRRTQRMPVDSLLSLSKQAQDRRARQAEVQDPSW